MRNRTWSGILIATVFAAAVAVAAQEPATSQAPATPPAASQAPDKSAPPATDPTTTSQAPPAAAPAPQSPEGRRITVAGCLQAAPPSPTGTSGSASAPAATTTDAAAKAAATSGDPKFVLANAVPSPAATAPDSAAPRTYRLIANDAALNPHVGKKLELTGTIDDQNSPAQSATAESRGSSTTASAESAPRLRVEAGKVVAESCTQ